MKLYNIVMRNVIKFGEQRTKMLLIRSPFSLEGLIRLWTLNGYKFSAWLNIYKLIGET